MSKLDKSKRKEKMKINLNELFRTAENFIGSLNPKDKLTIIYDTDPDGVCAAAITISTLRKLNFHAIDAIPRSPDFMKKYGMKCNLSNNVIILDLSADLLKKDLPRIKNAMKKILIIDHHLVWKINARNVFYVNPRIAEKEIYLPTSYLVFKFFSKYLKLDDVKWVAMLGTIADYGIKDTKDLIGKYMRKKDYKNIWDSEYGKFAMTMNSAIAVAGPEKSLKILLQTKSLAQFKRNNIFRKATERFEREFAQRKKEMMRRMEFYPEIGLRFTIINPKYFRRIASTLATRIGNKNKNSVFIILEKSGSIYRIHGRSTSNVSIAKLFKKLGVGGGHPAAGGGSIKVRELEEFKHSLINEVAKMRRFSRKKG